MLAEKASTAEFAEIAEIAEKNQFSANSALSAVKSPSKRARALCQFGSRWVLVMRSCQES